jgi:hypothetical protein
LCSFEKGALTLAYSLAYLLASRLLLRGIGDFRQHLAGEGTNIGDESLAAWWEREIWAREVKEAAGGRRTGGREKNERSGKRKSDGSLRLDDPPLPAVIFFPSDIPASSPIAGMGSRHWTPY